MKIPSLPKGAAGFPLVVVIGAVAVYYFIIKPRKERV